MGTLSKKLRRNLANHSQRLPGDYADVLPTANRLEILSRYHRLRGTGRELNNQLVERLSKDELNEGGKKIGILQGDTLVFENEQEAAVLVDYCIFDVRRNGLNSIERYLIDSPPDPESDERTCLRAMQNATYSVFVVESVELGLGVIVQDLLSQEVVLVVDEGLGMSAEVGLVIASRLMHHDGFSMTTGAALLNGSLAEEERSDFAEEFSRMRKTDDDGYFDPAPLIRVCLSKGSSSHVRYLEISGQKPLGRTIEQPRISNSLRSTPIGRNSPCPCGSGKKYKQCCITYL